MDFADPREHRVKIKESKKRDKNVEVVRQLRKLGNMDVRMIRNVVGQLKMVLK